MNLLVNSTLKFDLNPSKIEDYFVLACLTQYASSTSKVSL